MARSWAQLLGEADAAPEPEEQRGGMFSRLRDSLSKSRRALTGEIAAAAFDPGERGRLGAARGGADHGRRRRPRDGRARAPARGARRARDLNAALAERSPRSSASRRRSTSRGAPAVILVVGVNGTGKTTTIGKLAAKLARARALRRRRSGRHVPRRGRGAARDLGAARRRRLRRLRARRRSRRRRLRRDRGGAGARPRRRHRRHRRPTAHADEPDGGAREGAPRDRAASSTARRTRRCSSSTRRRARTASSRRGSSARRPASPASP